MDIKKIISSGLLELYVLGRLDSKETKVVEDAMSRSAEIKHEIQDTERALELYARSHSVTPDLQLKENILRQIRKDADAPDEKLPNPSPKFPWLSALLTFIALALAIGWMNQNKKIADLQSQHERDKIICDSIQSVQQNQIDLLNQINDRDNDIIAVTPTEKYPETDLYFHHNAVSQTNFIQVKNLPAIDLNQSYQLWSLKVDQPPIPMDVFRADDGSLLIPVEHEQNTSTYAITIEQLGGAQSPNLVDLVGTFTVS